MSEGGGIEVRYAETDDDVINIHRFLCVVAGPELPGPIDPVASIHEVWRIVNHECALYAVKDNLILGTIGLTQPNFWWNPKLKFLANRWFFCLPHSRAGKPLLREAKKIAASSDCELHIISETRGTVTIFNKSKKRSPAIGEVAE